MQAPFVDDRTRVLKHGGSFAVSDRSGDVRAVGSGEQGVYQEDTRFVSRCALFFGDARPSLLGSAVTDDGTVLSVDLCNPDLPDLPLGTIHLHRTIFLLDGVCHQRLQVTNHGDRPVALDLRLAVAADFADLFEVRGRTREARGHHHEPVPEGETLSIAYDGLDGVRRTARISGGPSCRAEPDGLRFAPTVRARARTTLEIAIACEVGPRERPPGRFADRLRERHRQQQEIAEGWTTVRTSDPVVDEWIGRSITDLRLLTTLTDHGPYPYAGVPWYSAPFGRDGIIAALAALWLAPDVGGGVLRFLAATQATEDDPLRMAQPGKIVHEVRSGEMAALGEVPFGRYHGTVDATPLFVMLADAHHAATGDADLVRELWPNLEAALAWIDGPGDPDGDGFVEYVSDPKGLVHQGWKDSDDPIFHADGRSARGPIALCEVQGYVYAAKVGAARLARTLGDGSVGDRLEAEAEELRLRFEEAFWCEDLGTYALALDGDERPCRVRTSNPGHLLWTGIASPERARRVADDLMSDRLFSGWGIRTVATSERRYRPISYHEGSVWPHDTAIAAAGLARYGFMREAVRLFDALLDASVHLELARLPELVCGFERRPDEGPTRYPPACEPQAWAATAAFQLLSACLGLEVDAAAGEVRCDQALLPQRLDWIELDGVRVGERRVDLRVERGADGGATLRYHRLR